MNLHWDFKGKGDEEGEIEREKGGREREEFSNNE